MRAAGFRACKLCKPDSFYRTYGESDEGDAGRKGEARNAAVVAYLDTIEEAPGPLTFAAYVPVRPGETRDRFASP